MFQSQSQSQGAPARLFDGYPALDGTFDEMFENGGPRPPCARVASLLDTIGKEELARYQALAERALLHQGVTFSVYGDARGTEKIFPFCLLPRLVGGSDWARLERGLQQRLRALGMFLDDIYGEQKIVRDKVFPAALLGRIVTIPYYPLSDEMLAAIIRLQLGRIRKRIEENHAVRFDCDDAVIGLVAKRCTELESGGRMIDAILTNTVLPRISEEFLKRMMSGQPVKGVGLSVANGDFAYNFS